MYCRAYEFRITSEMAIFFIQKLRWVRISSRVLFRFPNNTGMFFFFRNTAWFRLLCIDLYTNARVRCEFGAACDGCGPHTATRGCQLGVIYRSPGPSHSDTAAGRRRESACDRQKKDRHTHREKERKKVRNRVSGKKSNSWIARYGVKRDRATGNKRASRSCPFLSRFFSSDSFSLTFLPPPR